MNSFIVGQLTTFRKIYFKMSAADPRQNFRTLFVFRVTYPIYIYDQNYYQACRRLPFREGCKITSSLRKEGGVLLLLYGRCVDIKFMYQNDGRILLQHAWRYKTISLSESVIYIIHQILSKTGNIYRYTNNECCLYGKINDSSYMENIIFTNMSFVPLVLNALSRKRNLL